MQGTYIDLLRGRLNFTIVDVVVDVVVVVVVVVKVVVDDVVGQGVGLHPRILSVVALQLKPPLAGLMSINLDRS